MSKRPILLVMAGGELAGHIFPGFAIGKNLHFVNEDVSNV